jgi:glucokinase
MDSEQLVIGIDLGGTKIATALVNDTGTILSYDYRETLGEKGPEAVVARMADAARAVMAEAAVGIGSPGPLDIEAGVVLDTPNLPGWEYVPLTQPIEEALGIKTFLENDANAAALGEHRFGAGRGTQHMIYVTVSTGIGGGLILDGKLYHGFNGMAGEIGHVTILPGGPLCGCGNRGHLEAVSAGPAIARQARERVARGAPTLIVNLAEGDPARITARLVAEAASQGDAVAQEILAEAMEYLGIAMANYVNIFNPRVIVIGGGLSNIGDALFEPVRRIIKERAFPVPAQSVRVVPAELGDKVGVLGAAAVALARIG